MRPGWDTGVRVALSRDQGGSGRAEERRRVSIRAMSDGNFDAVVVGAGIAGSACAGMLARAGLSVALLDARSEEHAGPRWINAVPAAAFAAVGIAAPTGPELYASGHSFVLASPSAAVNVAIEDHGVIEVDMRHLGARLRRDAREAGVAMRFASTVDRVHVEDGRVRAVETGRDTLRAPLFVDASGMRAVLRRAAFPRWPAIDRAHLCAASQFVFAVADRAGAERYLERNGARAGVTVARTGVAGGFSILNVRVDLDAGEVCALTGSVQDEPGRPSGAAILDAFVKENPWIGARLFGGSGAIPLRRPYARLSAPGLALLGDAACMMFCAHGSGIATGLLAARLLADIVSAGGDPGAPSVTWRYAARYHRAHGGVLLAYDVIRRATQRLTREESEILLATGLVSRASLAAGFAQLPPPLDAAELLRVARGALKAPRLAARTALRVRNVPASLGHGKSYPEEPDLAALRRYEARSAALVGDAADPVA